MRLLLVAALAGVAWSGELRLGKPLTLAEPVKIQDVLSKPDQYLSKKIQVKGKVTEVCQMMGCWMALSGDGSVIRVKVNDGVIVFPKEAVGRMARAEGTLEKLELTREQALARARHEAEEQGRRFDPASIKGPAVIYQIAGSGAIVE